MVDEVRPGAIVLHPKVPAAVVVAVVHAGHDRAKAHRARQLDPGAVGELLLAIEIARVGDFERHLGLGGESFIGDFTGIPSGIGSQGHNARHRAHQYCHIAPFAFTQRGVKAKPLLGRFGGNRVFGRPGEPLVEAGPRGLLLRGNLLLGVRDAAFERIPKLAVVGRARHEDHRRRVLHVAIQGRLRRVVEERRQAIKLLLRQRIELVIMADRTAGRQAHPYARRGFGAVAGVEHAVFFVNRAAFASGDVAAIEARSDPLFVRRLRQQVAGQLLDGELIEGHIAVVSVDHPIAIGPDFAVGVDMDAVGVCIARGVQPVARSMFAPVRRCQQLIHQLIVSGWRTVVDERVDDVRRGRQTSKIEADSTDERAAVCLRRRIQTFPLQPGQHEAIDWIADPSRVFDRRQGGPHRRDKRPKLLILGSPGDPCLELFLLSRRKLPVQGCRRHHFVLVIGKDAMDHFTLVRLARRDRAGLDCRLAFVQSQVGFASRAVGAVAGKAVLRQYRANVSVEAQFLDLRRLP